MSSYNILSTVLHSSETILAFYISLISELSEDEGVGSISASTRLSAPGIFIASLFDARCVAVIMRRVTASRYYHYNEPRRHQPLFHARDYDDEHT